MKTKTKKIVAIDCEVKTAVFLEFEDGKPFTGLTEELEEQIGNSPYVVGWGFVGLTGYNVEFEFDSFEEAKEMFESAKANVVEIVNNFTRRTK